MKLAPILAGALLGTSISQAAPEVKTIAIGAQAPDFKLEGTDGKTYTLDSFKDSKYLVLSFTCNHCPDAIAARSKMSRFAADYKDKGVQVVAISSAAPEGVMIWENAFSKYDDDFESMKVVHEVEKLQHPYLYDGETQETSMAYGAVASPHVFILGPERKVIYQGHFDDGKRDPGPAKKNTVVDNIDLLLAGKPLTETKTRVFGCSTKWKWKTDLVEKDETRWQGFPVSVDALDAATAKQLAANPTKKYRLVNLWSTSCAPCVAEFPMLVNTYRRHALRPFELITISIDPKEDAQKVESFIKEQHLPLARFTQKSVANEGRTTNNYHFQGEDLEKLAAAIDPEWQGPLPHSVLIAPGGEIVWRHTGEVEEQELRNTIIDALDPYNKK